MVMPVESALTREGQCRYWRDMKTALFDFELPPERIADRPASPRDASRLLVVTAATLENSLIRQLTHHLREGDVMVFNDTKVIPARLMGKRGETQIEVMLLRNKSQQLWTAFAKPAKKLLPNDKVYFSEGFYAEILHKNQDGTVEISLYSNNIEHDLHAYGQMPLPPYIKRKAEVIDNENYQTVFAAKDGAVAAPTAGLHFTPELLNRIDASGIKRVHVTLHVGAGTFQPVKAEDTKDHVMHSEYAEISEYNAELLNLCRKNGGRIIAVGTTSLRVLETAASQDGRIQPFAGDTNIFITPGYIFKAVDGLLTNFHLPKSTLFMLVSAFMGLDRMQEAYKHAIEAQYRFYSYGDACLLMRN